jgi:hypothetical protein
MSAAAEKKGLPQHPAGQLVRKTTLPCCACLRDVTPQVEGHSALMPANFTTLPPLLSFIGDQPAAVERAMIVPPRSARRALMPVMLAASVNDNSRNFSSSIATAALEHEDDLSVLFLQCLR